MKRIMSVLTLVVFLASAVAMVSFTVAENNNQETGWFYVNPSNPNQAGDPVLGSDPQCGTPNSNMCAREFHIEEGIATDPTTEPAVYGNRL